MRISRVAVIVAGLAAIAGCTTANGTAGPRPGNIGPPVNPAETTKVVEFNDAPALEQALAAGDVACVLAEPAMTNVGIVHPQPGYHKTLRELTRKYETLLIIDETHTICAGPGGYTRAENLQPDVIVFGKAIGAVGALRANQPAQCDARAYQNGGRRRIERDERR